MRHGNLSADIPNALPAELFTPLAARGRVRIERIVSRGHASPPDFWYDQPEHELVVVMSGAARIGFADGRERALGPGDWLEIPAHVRHRVVETAADHDTIWLAIFYP